MPALVSAELTRRRRKMAVIETVRFWTKTDPREVAP